MRFYVLAATLALATACTAPPQATNAPFAALRLDDEVRWYPNDDAEFLMDWCEFKLSPEEQEALNAWSLENMRDDYK